MKYVECPEKYTFDDLDSDILHKKISSLFIAGGITGCSNWQEEFVEMLKDENIILFNPRRKDFSSENVGIVEEQISWEFDYLKKCTATSFWFTQETLCPITLFELGKQAVLNKPLFVGVHPNYARKIDLEIQLKLLRPDVIIVYDLDSLAEQVRLWLKYAEKNFF